MTWQPIETMPEDETVLLATTGGWVSTAWRVTDEDTGVPEYFWFGNSPIHKNHKPLGWMPLPAPPVKP